MIATQNASTRHPARCTAALNESTQSAAIPALLSISIALNVSSDRLINH
ncbi:MAG: hypothetical protein HY785_10305 [Oscillatoriophycideae cyanobacterium NC_groundwater_1537_Pr4_S-0.65um_50_18]|nr:hypothetical protein [Oscillatoriophycideae cyanobacterium NC_groundwater_1537_Pr4_S-0.65um_50_18]